MNNKEELLQQLKEKIETGEIRYEDIKKIEKKKPFNMKIPYIIGGIILIIGILGLISQIWDHIGLIGQVGMTLILGTIMTIIGSILLKQEKKDTLGIVFHVLGAILIPLGITVLMSNLNLLNDFLSLAVISMILFIFYLALAVFHQKSFLTIVSIFYAITSINLFLLINRFTNFTQALPYLSIIIGLSLLLLSYQWRKGWNKGITPILSISGSIIFWSSSLYQILDYEKSIFIILYFILVSLGLFVFKKTKDRFASFITVFFLAISLSISLNIVSLWIYPILLAYSFYLSTLINNKLALFFSSLFLITYIGMLTTEYFTYSLGWPIILILMGFVILAVGKFSINISKKYIK
jgi:hypothetical protein